MTKKTLKAFEQTHGTGKITKLERDLAIEKAKVAALGGQERITIKRSDDCKVSFGLIGDTHYGSLYDDPAAIRAFYEYAADAGIEDIYHCGDVLDGHKIYKGQEFEVRDLGLEAQVQRLIDCAPDATGIKTHYVLGNHDVSFKHLAGAAVGKMISSARKDWICLGQDQADIIHKTPAGDFRVRLLHPGGGSAYSLSYRPQKIVEQIEGGTKPNFLGIGHYHKAEMLPSYRNVCVVQSGTFQRQTPFMARGGLAAHVGGWIVNVMVGEKTHCIRAEFVAFY